VTRLLVFLVVAVIAAAWFMVRVLCPLGVVAAFGGIALCAVYVVAGLAASHWVLSGEDALAGVVLYGCVWVLRLCRRKLAGHLAAVGMAP
jgi:hypothetical protein